MQGNELRKKKKKVSTKKTSKISKKSSPRASDTGKGSYKHNAPDLWDRGYFFYPLQSTLVYVSHPDVSFHPEAERAKTIG